MPGERSTAYSPRGELNGWRSATDEPLTEEFKPWVHSVDEVLREDPSSATTRAVLLGELPALASPRELTRVISFHVTAEDHQMECEPRVLAPDHQT